MQAFPTVLVTGATGKTGSLVVRALRRLGWPVRALVRREDARSHALRALGADIVVAELSDPAPLAHALRGVQRAYFCPPMSPHMLQAAVTFAAAATDARVESIVGMSQWLASPDHPSLITRQHWLVDQMFSRLPGIGYTCVRPGYFADNYLIPMGLAVHLGLYASIAPEGRNAPPSNEDIARVVTAALVDPHTHAGHAYRPTGPALIGEPEIVATLERVLDRRLRVLPVPQWLLLKNARSLGVPIEQMSELRHYVRDHQSGAFELGAPTTHVLDVTGQPAEDFETIVRRYVTRPEYRRTRANTVRQWLAFLALPLRPGFDLDRYDRTLAAPQPSRPQYAAASATWRREHAIDARGLA